MPKIYIVKWAVTRGILEAEVPSTDISEEGYATIRSGKSSCSYGFALSPKEWAYTFEDAVQKANPLRERAIKSAKKKLDKLEKMKFATPKSIWSD